MVHAFPLTLGICRYAQPQNNVTMVLKKYNLESRLLEFLPPGQRTTEEFGKLCEQAGGLQVRTVNIFCFGFVFFFFVVLLRPFFFFFFFGFNNGLNI